MECFNIKKLYPDASLPRRATSGSSGLDLFAYIDGQDRRITLQNKPVLIGTGIAIEIPRGYDVQIRPRSGLAAKGVIATLGTIDSDYRGEIMVTLYTIGQDNSFEVKHGDRIAQLVVSKLADIDVVEADELSSTRRGTGSHGSTGMV